MDNNFTLSQIPVGINGFYGDSLQPNQWKDTLAKLEDLHTTNHQGSIMIPTKYVISDEQLDIIANNFPNVWVFMAITGLNETKIFSLQEYLDAYLKICSKLKNVVCAIRPIVEGQNDNLEILKPILETVSQGNKLLTYRGFRDPFTKGSQKYVNDNIFDEIENFCSERKITTAQRCVSIISKVKNETCYLDIEAQPVNIELLGQLGYDIELKNSKLNVLGYRGNKNISKGDMSFIHMLSKSKPISRNYEHSEILSIELKNNLKLVSTSSWFSWASQTACRVGCWYCFADYKSDVRINLPHFGCNPSKLINLLK